MVLIAHECNENYGYLYRANCTSFVASMQLSSMRKDVYKLTRYGSNDFDSLPVSWTVFVKNLEDMDSDDWGSDSDSDSSSDDSGDDGNMLKGRAKWLKKTDDTADVKKRKDAKRAAKLEEGKKDRKEKVTGSFIIWNLVLLFLSLYKIKRAKGGGCLRR